MSLAAPWKLSGYASVSNTSHDGQRKSTGELRNNVFLENKLSGGRFHQNQAIYG